jgi:hypothetical protein
MAIRPGLSKKPFHPQDSLIKITNKFKEDQDILGCTEPSQKVKTKTKTKDYP